MNSQQTQTCTQAPIICSANEYIESLARVFRELAEEIREHGERKVLYRKYGMLNAAQLRDIGMDDPQKQLEILGRYL